MKMVSRLLFMVLLIVLAGKRNLPLGSLLEIIEFSRYDLEETND